MGADPKDIQLTELKDIIKELNNTIKELQAMLKEEREQNAVLKEQLELLTKKLFGKKSEKTAPWPGQMDIYGLMDPDHNTDIDVEDSFVEYEEVIVKRPKKNKRTYEETFKGIPTEEVIIDELPEEERICPECGSELVPVGKELKRKELKFIPAKLKVIEYYAVTYGCPVCSKEGERAVFVKAQVPPPLIPHSYASADTVSWAMYQKFANGVPGYRQEKDWEQYGAKIHRNTLANWIIFCSDKYLKPLYEFFRRKLLERDFLMADETRIQVLKEPERNPETDSFMWLFRTGEDGKDPVIIYKYTQTRAKYNAKDFLEGWSGYLEADGYQGYNNLPGVKRCSCWAHLRRYYSDAIPQGREKDMTCPAVQGVVYCNKLFNEERISREKGENYKQRYERRLKKEKPIIDAFFAWLDRQHPVKGSRMYAAVNYTYNRKEDLVRYLEDGRCSFSNNLAENAIRPFTLGRKNWLFADTPEGAEANAIVYTMVEMARAYGLNIFEYLKYVLDKRPDKEWTDEQLEEAAPWNEEVKLKCKGSGCR